MKLPRLWLICLVAGLLGCASANLTVISDLYMEDPRLSPVMTPTRVDGLRRGLDQIEIAARQRNRDLKIIADLHFELYELLYLAINSDKADLNPLRIQLQQHRDLIDARLPPLIAEIEAADLELQGYLADYRRVKEALALETEITRDCKPDGHSAIRPTPERILRERQHQRQLNEKLSGLQTSANNKVNDVNIAYANFLTPLESPFRLEEYFTAIVGSIDRLAARFEEDNKFQELNKLRAAGPRIQDKIAEIREFTLYLESEYGANLPVVQLQNNSADSVFENAAEIGRALQNLPRALLANRRGQEGLAAIVRARSHYYNLIDRLQDAGDPVWRIVSDPANECLWNTEFTETLFYAEGDASVVVVRDSPAEYRVQRAMNNPAALVQAQLEVSRAIASAAISVAGAASGVPPDALSAAKADGMVQPGSSKTASDAEALARRKAELEVAARRRSAAVNSLSTSLRNLMMSFASTEDEAEYSRLVRRLQASLKSHAVIFDFEPSP